MNDSKTKIKAQISSLLGKAGIPHTDGHVEQIIHITNGFKDNGYKISYGKVAEFISSQENRDILEDIGLDKVLKSMPYMKLGTITKEKKQCRNEACGCGSGKKFKKCCLN